MYLFLRNIVEFMDVLRTAGIRVSSSEAIDAVKGLEYIDLLEKRAVRTALSACLAKSEEDRRIFNEAFERFFIDVGLRSEHVKNVTGMKQQIRQEIEEKAKELKFMDESINLEEQQKEVYAALSETEKQSIREFLERTSTGKNVKSSFKPIAEAVVKSKLDSLRSRYAGSLAYDINVEGESEAGIIAGDVIKTIRKEDELMHRNLGEISDEDVSKLIQLIELLTSRILKSVSHQRKRSNKQERVDLKKTIRSSFQTGGVPFTLKFRRRPQKKYRYLILCDVSASMYRFSGFVLQMMKGLLSAMISSDCYIFSEEAEHIHLNEFGNILKFEQKVKNSRVWRKGTDIARVLGYLKGESNIVVNSSTIVIIVSDAKTVNPERTAEILKNISRSAGKILWFNPIPQSEWTRIPAVEGFRESCTMMDCSTLDKLYSTGWLLSK